MSKKSKIPLIISIVLFLLLVLLIQVDWTTGFESWFYLEATEKMNNNLTKIFIFITNLGAASSVILLSLFLLIIPKTRFRYGIYVSVSVIIATITNMLLKVLFMRERPDILRIVHETSYSFPSGHAMVNAALYGTISILIYKQFKDKKIKIGFIAFLSLLTLLIGYSRVYLGVHYITDVIGGWLFGIIISILVYNTIKKRKKNIVSCEVNTK